MRIVIDLQGAQAENRNRGIGRYSLSLAQAIVREAKQHEIVIALNASFPESAAEIRDQFLPFMPSKNIQTWQSISGISFLECQSRWRRKSATALRLAFLEKLQPDILHVSSLFEGLVDDAITCFDSPNRSYKVAVTLYDLIPLIYPDYYLKNKIVNDWYSLKLKQLKSADLWLAISNSSRNEGVSLLGLPEARSINISADTSAIFRKHAISLEEETNLRIKYSLNRPFIMYGGGIDYRKNIEALIRAYSSLPFDIRHKHQLAIVCSIPQESRDALNELARVSGLQRDELILTGFVPESELVQLYCLCKLFVFPSWHEGFGLPVLEAMRCGAPVISSNRSSLPEVIGLPDALFDPFSIEAITHAIQRALSDDSYRNRLAQHGLERAKAFSWDMSAKATISHFESLIKSPLRAQSRTIRNVKLKLAYVSPTPPDRSGIADYTLDLLSSLHQYYSIDVVKPISADNLPIPLPPCNIVSLDHFKTNFRSYDRVVYHFGNSTFHSHMFEMLRSFPGVVVLHDFYLSGVLNHMEHAEPSCNIWTRSLYNSHGYSALKMRFGSEDASNTIWEYPCIFDVISDSVGVIVHSQFALRLACACGFHGLDDKWTVLPLVRRPPLSKSRAAARQILGLTQHQFVVCSFGMIGPLKLSHRILDAWTASGSRASNDSALLFVGENPNTSYGKELAASVTRASTSNNINITGWTTPEQYQLYLRAADMAVQLRTNTRGETSAAVLDCLNYGVPTIVNAHGSLAELPDDAVYKLPDNFCNSELSDALTTLYLNANARKNMSLCGQKLVSSNHNPDKVASMVYDAVEEFYRRNPPFLNDILRNLPPDNADDPCDAHLPELAAAIAATFKAPFPQQQLLVDISELVRRDSGTGIQRVVRNILREWLRNTPKGYRIEPVYAEQTGSYLYARKYTTRFLHFGEEILEDEPVSVHSGDLFIGLDLQPAVVSAHRDSYQRFRCAGARVVFVVYDLLCHNLPHCFYPGAAESFQRWIDVVLDCDGAVCISKTVAEELLAYAESKASDRKHKFTVKWFHLGANFGFEENKDGVQPHLSNTSKPIGKETTDFLMVGTLEPRKGHDQVLSAFEILWRNQEKVTLTIAGRKGWMVDELLNRIRHHPESGTKINWLDSASDAELDILYARSDCLIAASYGEGFGLPLVEAAQKGIALLVRDIPIFREVGGDHAAFFKATSAHDLAEEIKSWLVKFKNDKHPKSIGMKCLSWTESAEKLFSKII